ncbi:MAG: hypothetical protein ACLQGP_35655 [Isosphaeraceae bacterium]
MNPGRGDGLARLHEPALDPSPGPQLHLTRLPVGFEVHFGVAGVVDGDEGRSLELGGEGERALAVGDDLLVGRPGVLVLVFDAEHLRIRGQVDPRPRDGLALRADDPAPHGRRRLEPKIEGRSP